MSTDAVLFESDGRVATITLNRPDNRNSMTPDVLAGFAAAIGRVRGDRGLRCVVITGRGSSFCAGADFRSASTPDGAVPASGLPHEKALDTYQPFLSVLDIEVPTIAALNGHAIGGGFGLALLCDLRIANRNARYGANFARLGFTSGMAISYVLPRIVGLPLAADLLFSARIVTGAEAERLGLVHQAVPADEVGAEAERRAREIATGAPLALRLMKRSLYQSLGWNPRAAAESEAWAQSATLATDDAREGIQALLEKRVPDFKGR